MMKAKTGMGQGKMQCPTCAGRMGRMGRMQGMGQRHAIAGSFFLNPMAVKQLNLDKTQVDKLENMKADHKKKMIDAMANIQKMNVDLKLLMRGVDINIPAVQTKLQQIADAKVKMKVAHLQAFESARAVLNPEQKKKLEEIWKGPGQMRKMQGPKQGMEEFHVGMEPSDDMMAEEMMGFDDGPMPGDDSPEMP
jgi:Spy/CpxP family protein refolding chaperone